MNLYEVLGVSARSSSDRIRKRYRELAFELHPDRGGDIARFRRVSAAYEVLKDPGSRARYDLRSSYGSVAAVVGLPPLEGLESFIREYEDLARGVKERVHETMQSLRRSGVIGGGRNRNGSWRPRRG